MAKHKLLPSALGVMLSLIPLQASSEVWLSAIDPYTRQAMKPGDPSDFMALFTPTAPWQQAAGGINVFKTTTQWLLNASDADLTTMFNDLRRRDIALAFEAGMMPQTTTCGGGEGYSQPSDIATLAQRVKRLGGDLKYVAMDEPLWYGHHYQGPNACQLSIPDLAASLVTNFNALRAVFPNVLIGDIEPLSLATVPDWLDELMAFATAYKSTTGAKLDFIDADVQWGEDYLSELQQLTTRVHAAGLKVGIIYNGDATDQTDVAWTTRAEQRFTAIEAESMSREEFLKKAAPAVTFFEVLRDARLPRVIELLNKTNQFNTTGRRWMAAKLTNRRIFAFEVEDAYTQYGLVGVVLTSGVTIEQWVMSCRVLGYQVEVAVRDMVVAALRKDSDTLVYGRLVKTEANSPCRDLFAKCGFVVADTDRWVLAKDKNVSVPPHVTMRSNGGIIG